MGDATRVADLPIDDRTEVIFSPDGKWLMTTAAPCRLWAVGTWTNSAADRRRGSLLFPRRRQLIVQDADKILRLVETETGRTVARLESPDSCDVTWATFSPDGSRLVVTTHDGPAVHVWDLRAIRRRLAMMGLDWDAPAYSDDDPADPSVPPLPPLQIDLGPLANEFEHFTESPDDVDREANGATQEQSRRRRGLPPSRSCLEPTSSQPRGDRRLCRRHPPAPGRRSPARNSGFLLQRQERGSWLQGRARPRPVLGLSLAPAPSSWPQRASLLEQLGVAQYRADLDADATSTLERSLAVSRGETDAFDLFFLEMAHHRQGHREQARDSCDRALSWLESQKPSSPIRQRTDAIRADAQRSGQAPRANCPLRSSRHDADRPARAVSGDG